MLGVQIQHFESLHNIKFNNNNGMYCCCDGDCMEGAFDKSKTSHMCGAMCQPYFVLHFKACPSSGTCLIAKNITVPEEFTSVISAFIVQIPFNQSELEMYNQVRLCNCTMNIVRERERYREGEGERESSSLQIYLFFQSLL